MATLSRNQVVLEALRSDRSGDSMVNETIQVTKTATMTHGTLLKADRTEADDAAITAGSVRYVIDDLWIDDLKTGDVGTVRAVKELDWVIFRQEELRVGSTALTAAQLTTFGKKYQKYHKVSA